jgi:hypothetical protein
VKRLLVLILLLFPLPLYADVISYSHDGPFPYVAVILDQVGIGSSNFGAETTATTFIVPGSPGTLTDLTFTDQADYGTYLFTFGIYRVADVTANPIAQKELYAVQAISNGVLIFDNRIHVPFATATVSVQAGTEVGFFLIPNDTIANFLANPDSYYDALANSNFWAKRSPLFSVSDANPGEFDQLMSFVDLGITLFTWEDLTRIPIGGSDSSFADLGFTIDVALEPGDTGQGGDEDEDTDESGD